MSPDTNGGGSRSITDKFNNMGFLFQWLTFFYPKAKGIHFIYLADVFFPQKILRIGNNFLFGMNAVVLPGISTGNNVAIGATSTVTKDIHSIRSPQGIHAGS